MNYIILSSCSSDFIQIFPRADYDGKHKPLPRGSVFDHFRKQKVALMTLTMTLVIVRMLAAVAALAYRASSFSPICSKSNDHATNHCLPSATSSSRLFSLIKGEAYGSEPFDENEGGVGLAKRCAVKIVGGGSVRRNKSSTNTESGVDGGSSIEAHELYRYERLTPLDKSDITKSIKEGKYGDIQLLCSGTGKELYVDPGSSYRVEDKVIELAPLEAAKNALSSIAATSSAAIDHSKTSSIVFNFLGGDELIIGEVLMACDMLVEGLNLPATMKLEFNSISHVDVPSDVCHVTVVSVGGSSVGGGSASLSPSSEKPDIDQSVARGELYDRDGKWFTVSRRDMIIN